MENDHGSRRLLGEAHRRSEEFGFQVANSLDRSLLTLSAGGIGVSLTFLEKIEASVGWLVLLLYGSWVAFVLCIYYTIRSMRESADRLAEETTFYNLTWVEQLTGEISEDEMKERQESLDNSRQLLKATRTSNRWARWAFFAGLGILLAFGFLAVHGIGAGEMTDIRETEKAVVPDTDREGKGYTGGGVNPILEPKPSSQGGTETQEGTQSGGSSSGDKPASGGGASGDSGPAEKRSD